MKTLIISLLLFSLALPLRAQVYPVSTNASAVQTLYGTYTFINPVAFSSMYVGTLVPTNMYANLAGSTNLPGSGLQASSVNSNRFDAGTAAQLALARTQTNISYTAVTNLGSAPIAGSQVTGATTVTNGLATTAYADSETNAVGIVQIVTNAGPLAVKVGNAVLADTATTSSALSAGATIAAANGMALTNMVYPMAGQGQSVSLTANQVKYESLLGALQVAGAATEANVEVVMGLQAPFILTNFTIAARSGTLGANTNMTFRIFTNGVSANLMWTLFGGATSFYMTNDTSSSLIIPGTAWTNVFTLQVSNNAAATATAFSPSWSFQIVK